MEKASMIIKEKKEEDESVKKNSPHIQQKKLFLEDIMPINLQSR